MRLPRPSAPLAVSFLALFVALGGVSWAAIHLPPNSVGSAQLKNFSVGNVKLGPNSVGPRKIIPASVGATQVDPTQVQLRVTSSCSIGAIQSLSQAGNVTCTPALPNEYGTQSQTATLTGSQTQIATSHSPVPRRAPPTWRSGPCRSPRSGGPVPRRSTSPARCRHPARRAPRATSTRTSAAAMPTAAKGTIPLVAPVSVAGSPQTLAINCTDTGDAGESGAEHQRHRDDPCRPNRRRRRQLTEPTTLRAMSKQR